MAFSQNFFFRSTVLLVQILFGNCFQGFLLTLWGKGYKSGKEVEFLSVTNCAKGNKHLPFPRR